MDDIIDDNDGTAERGEAAVRAALEQYESDCDSAHSACTRLAFTLVATHPDEVLSSARLVQRYGIPLVTANALIHLLVGRGYAHRHFESCLVYVAAEGDEFDTAEAREQLQFAADERRLRHSQSDGIELSDCCFVCASE